MAGFIHLMPQATQPGQLDQSPQRPGTPDNPSSPGQEFWGVPGADTQREHNSSAKATGQGAQLGSNTIPSRLLPSPASDSTSGSSLSKRPFQGQGSTLQGHGASQHLLGEGSLFGAGGVRPGISHTTCNEAGSRVSRGDIRSGES